MPANEIALIVNPGANRGRAPERIARVETLLRERGIPYRVTRTKTYEEIEPAARRAREEGCRVVVSCGGDGTNRAVAAALAETGTPMGVLCGGRGNDLARALGIPCDLDAAVRTIIEGHTRTIDLGSTGEAVFTTVATLGIDSEVSRRARDHRVGALARFSYPMAVIGAVLGYRPQKIVLEGDFGRREERVLLAATANTSYYGKGMEIAPGADPEDGLFHVCLIHPIPRLKLLRLYPTVYRGNHLRFPEVELLQTSRLRLESEEPLILFADGEELGTTPMELSVKPGALRVCVPKP